MARYPFGGGTDRDWCMLKDRVWQAATAGSPRKRFLCVLCTERRLGRRLDANDFRRSAKVNFVGRKSKRLRHRMRGLKPAKQMFNTRFTV
jgi:hypothetical protein